MSVLTEPFMQDQPDPRPTRNNHRRLGLIVSAACGALISGCGTTPVAQVSSHLRQATPTENAVPEKKSVPNVVRQVPLPPPPKSSVDEKRYSVAVVDVPARDILLAISRDTGINIDIHPGIEGRVTLNAIDQTIRQILTRMSKQIDMRWETDGVNLSAMPDVPYLKTYRVDYVNINRETTGSFGVQTQSISPAGATQATTGGGGGGSQNSAQLKVENSSKNRFWESLEKNVKDLLRETDKELPAGSSETYVRNAAQAANTATTRTQPAANTRTGNAKPATVTTPGESQTQVESVSQVLTFREAASVIVNPETGTIAVRATSRQHEKIGQFIELVAGVAKRQVLIEATVVEVTLSDDYQSGIDWSFAALNGGYSIGQTFASLLGTSTTATGATTASASTLGYTNAGTSGGRISSTVKLLSSFGTTKVLSSPRTTTLNNQTAVLKVVENKVYFTIKADPTTTTNANGTTSTTYTYTTTPNVVPVGFVMSVTPQIGENDVVTLNIRPSITRISSFVADPNPVLYADPKNVISNQIPIIQTREFENVLRVPSGETAVLGGLMQDSFKSSRDGLPAVSRIPILGDAVSARNDAGLKTELVIFIRPVVIKDASVETDFSEYKRYLPDRKFFKEAEPVVALPIPSIEHSGAAASGK